MSLYIRFALYLTEVLVLARADVGHVGPLRHSVDVVLLLVDGVVDAPVANLRPASKVGLGVAAELGRQDPWIRAWMSIRM